MHLRRELLSLACAAAALAAAAQALPGQSVLERPPNLAGSWVGTPGTLHFNFLHRFLASSAPERKVSAIPTFLLAASLPAGTLVGLHYSSNSPIAPRYPNEWELFGRWAALRQERGAWLDLAVQAGWNAAGRSIDGELSAARRIGRLKVMGAGRAFSSAFDEGDARVALAGGAAVQLHRYVAVAADAGSLLEREPGERVAWSAALQLAIPFTPHTLSLQATNTSTATLEGASLGGEETRYGFEFTIPLTLSRYIRRGAPDPPPLAGAATDALAPRPPSVADEVAATIVNLRFSPDTIVVSPGTTIVWTNRDPIEHTVTADDGSFDSGMLATSQAWRRTFDTAGTYPFHCTPHPFMKGVVVVR